MAQPAILFSSHLDDPALWRATVEREIPDLDFRIWPDAGKLDDIEYGLVWTIPDGTLRKLPNLRAIFSLGAGVDQILRDPLFPKEVPLFRLVDAGLREQMTQYAVYGALHWHRRMDTYKEQQAKHEWKMLPAAHPSDYTVGVMGLGVFGSDIAAKLALLGFRVLGWSRTKKEIPGVETCAGRASLESFLSQSQILINILPLTNETRGILDRALFSKLPKGSALIHMGRGGHLNTDDLLVALERGILGWAMLDVFPKEPLDDNSPLWDHPRVFVTPHIGAQAIGSTAENHVVAKIQDFRRGIEPDGRVDPSIGY
jgi:glyoxylate/hydroxypyruvate reductase A